jgi:hypothetical protein
MADLYADEDFSYPVIQKLRQLGHDVLTAQEAGHGNRGTTDDQVLAFALATSRAVVTFNRRHFIRLHQQGAPHLGIIVCTRDTDVDALAARIDNAVSRQQSLANQLIRVVRAARP